MGRYAGNHGDEVPGEDELAAQQPGDQPMTPDEIKSRVGRRLRELRDAYGWSIAELQNQTGIDGSSLSRFETGRRLPLAQHIFKLAEAYHIHVGELLDDAPIAATPAERQLLLTYRRLSLPGRSAILAATQAWAEREAAGGD